MKRNEREDALMKQLLVPYTEQALRQIEVYSRIPHKYSARFQAKKERILWHGGRTKLKTRVILAAMILIVLVCAACVAPSLAERYRPLFWADTYEVVKFNRYDAVLEGEYPPGMPSYVPAGYRTVEEGIAYNSAYKGRNNGEQKFVVSYNGKDFLYLRRHSDVDEMAFDSDNIHYDLDTVAGEKQNYVLQRYTDGRPETAIGWKTGDYCYTIRGNLSEAELLKMAESLTEDPCPFLAPAYIPDGFSETACSYSDEWQYFTYTDEDERQILFTRRNWEAEWGNYPFDDIVSGYEEYETGEITVNGNVGTWIDSTDGMYHHIRWQENSWWYEIGGETELEELIRMAESIGPTRYRKESDYPEKN